jgi:cytochrome c553
VNGIAPELRATARAALLTALLASAPASAADPGTVERGRQIAAGAGLGPDLACARCHGAAGEGQPATGAPRLAGQPELYLEKQLEDFAAGSRPSGQVAPAAHRLEESQQDAVAAWYASLYATPYPPQPTGDPALIQQGGVLSAQGDAARGLRPCELCHAAAGVGIGPSFPYLAGQYADYTAAQLHAWRRGERRNDPLNVMAEIAKTLTDDEITALALYFARVRPLAAAVASPIPQEPIPPPPE